MQTNRAFSKNFNRTNVRQFGGYNSLVGAPTRMTLTGTYSDNSTLTIKEVLTDLEEVGFKFYRNKVMNFTLDGSEEIESANTQFIRVKAKDFPINITGNKITFGFTDEELTKYKTALENYDVQGWGIEIPKNIEQYTEVLLNGTGKSLKIRLFNSCSRKTNIKIGLLPEIQIFEE